MFKFNKNFGQNFISDEKLINRIVDNANIDKDTLVRLTVVSVNSGELSLPVKSSYTFRFGR